MKAKELGRVCRHQENRAFPSGLPSPWNDPSSDSTQRRPPSPDKQPGNYHLQWKPSVWFNYIWKMMWKHEVSTQWGNYCISAIYEIYEQSLPPHAHLSNGKESWPLIIFPSNGLFQVFPASHWGRVSGNSDYERLLHIGCLSAVKILQTEGNFLKM